MDRLRALLATYANDVSPACDPDAQHILWMLSEMEARLCEVHETAEAREESIAKRNRWLGFVQALLYARGVRTIDELREETRGI